MLHRVVLLVALCACGSSGEALPDGSDALLPDALVTRCYDLCWRCPSSQGPENPYSGVGVALELRASELREVLFHLDGGSVVSSRWTPRPDGCVDIAAIRIDGWDYLEAFTFCPGGGSMGQMGSCLGEPAECASQGEYVRHGSTVLRVEEQSAPFALDVRATETACP